MRPLLQKAILVVIASSATGQEKATPAAVADEVLASSADEPKLIALANRKRPDQWLVVEELLRRDRRAAAQRYAAAIQGPVGPPLVRFAATGAVAARDSKAAVALAKASAARATKDWPAVVAHARAGLAAGPAPITRTRAAYAEGTGLWLLKRYKEAAVALARAGASARELGWWNVVIAAERLCGHAHVRAGNRQEAVNAWDRHLAAATTIDDHAQRAVALNNGGVALEEMGRRDESFALFEKWALAASAAGNPNEISRAYRAVGEGLESRGRYREALVALERSLEAARRSGSKVHIGTAILARGSARYGSGDAQGALADATVAFQVAQEIRDVLLGARAKNNGGVALERLGKIDDALQAFQQAKALAEKARHGGVFMEASANFARIVRKRGDPVRALALFDQVIKQARAARRLDLVATCSTQRGTILAATGRTEQALAAHKEAYELSMSLGRRSDAARALANAAIVHHGRGETQLALEGFERTLALAESIGDATLTARTLRWIGTVQERLGRIEEARDCLTRALALSRKSKSPRAVHDALTGLGSLEEGLGAHRAALKHFDEALRIAKELEFAQETAGALMNLGNSAASLGRFQEALQCYAQSLEIAKRVKNRADVVALTLNIGSVHQRRGRYVDALSAYEDALVAMRGIKDPHTHALVRNNLGMLHFAMGNVKKGVSHLKVAHAIFAEEGAKADAIQTLVNLGLGQQMENDVAGAIAVYREAAAAARADGNVALLGLAIGRLGPALLVAGRRDEAQRTLEEALRLAKAAGVPERQCDAMAGLGRLELKAGRPAEALARFEQALAFRDQGFRSPRLILAFVGSVEALLKLGRADEAVVRAREAAAMVRAQFLGLGAEQGARGRDEWTRVFTLGIEAAVEAEDGAALLAMAESGRADALLEALQAREALWSIVVPENLRDEQLQARAAERRAERALRRARESGKRKSLRAASEGLKAARVRRGEVIAQIEREAKKVAPLIYGDAPTLAECREMLGAGNALVVFAMGERRTAALVVTAAGARIVALPDRRKLDALLHDLLPEGRPFVHEPSMAAARRALIDTLDLPRTTRRLLVSPSGRLAYVPFAALAPEFEVAFLPSASVYRLLGSASRVRGAGVLGVGDPAYGARGDSRLQPLPGTRGEVEAVGTIKLLGADATEGRLISTLATRERWRAVHIACHGLIDPTTPRASALALAAGDADDGMLTCYDIATLKIDADLAVLSACDTARGRIYRTDGIMGLTHSFMCAGAPRVICSLWKVDDEATRVLMVKFYELWESGETETATALKKAQEFVRSHGRWKHPRYWAAWQLWGLAE